jgi:hypothetical protein
VLVTTPSKRYSSGDYIPMLGDLSLPQPQASYPSVSNQTLRAFDPPGVDTYVLYGTGVDTAKSLEYKEDFSSKTPSPPNVVHEGRGRSCSEHHDPWAIRLSGWPGRELSITRTAGHWADEIPVRGVHAKTYSMYH